MYCPVCGTKVQSNFCPNCGEDLRNRSVPKAGGTYADYLRFYPDKLAAIRALRDAGLVEKLPEKMKQAALARENNPAASLTELAALMEPPISKPAMNNRLKKLMQASKETEK